MGTVYRYIDTKDGITKYVGIVWKEDISNRVQQHRRDDWYKNSTWEIKCLNYETNTRTDAEVLESHFIAYYNSDKYYNYQKSKWGTSSFVPQFSEDDWYIYEDLQPVRNKSPYADIVQNIFYKQKYDELKRENEKLLQENLYLKQYIESFEYNNNSLNGVTKEMIQHFSDNCLVECDNRKRRGNGKGSFGIKKIKGTKYYYYRSVEGKYIYGKNKDELYLKMMNKGYYYKIPNNII